MRHFWPMPSSCSSESPTSAWRRVLPQTAPATTARRSVGPLGLAHAAPRTGHRTDGKRRRTRKPAAHGSRRRRPRWHVPEAATGSPSRDGGSVGSPGGGDARARGPLLRQPRQPDAGGGAVLRPPDAPGGARPRLSPDGSASPDRDDQPCGLGLLARPRGGRSVGADTREAGDPWRAGCDRGVLVLRTRRYTGLCDGPVDRRPSPPYRRRDPDLRRHLPDRRAGTSRDAHESRRSARVVPALLRRFQYVWRGIVPDADAAVLRRRVGHGLPPLQLWSVGLWSGAPPGAHPLGPPQRGDPRAGWLCSLLPHPRSRRARGRIQQGQCGLGAPLSILRDDRPRRSGYPRRLRPWTSPHHARLLLLDEVQPGGVLRRGLAVAVYPTRLPIDGGDPQG